MDPFQKAIKLWLESGKGCVSDSYYNGVLIQEILKPAPAEMIHDEAYEFEADLLGIRYQFVQQKTVSIDFYGYIVRICKDEREVSCSLGEVVKLLKSPHHFGFHYLEIYLALGLDQINDYIRRACESMGVGIIRITNSEITDIVVNEIVEASQIIWQGLSYSNDRSPGNFYQAVKDLNYLTDFFRSNPDNFFYKVVQPRTTS